MHILYLYPEITIKGGADKVIAEKANYFATHGYEVTLVTESQMGREPSFPLSDKVRHVDMGLDFYKQYTQNIIMRAVTYTTLMRSYKRQLSQLLSELKPDIVITALGRSIDILPAMKDGSVKLGEAHSVRAHLRSFYLIEQKGFFYRMAVKWMRRSTYRKIAKLDALVLLTPEDADSWPEVSCRFVIPNAAPPLPQSVSTLRQKRAIIAARYNDAKGYDYLIEAWSMVHRQHPDWTLDVYGSGELHDEVVRLIEQHKLTESIILHEPVDNIMEKYLESSIYVMSSRFEAFSLVLLESMACGVPCVAFDCPNGPRNIIRNGEDGLLVDYLNPKALADGICRLIDDEPLRHRLGEHARRNVQRFSREAIMQQWEEVFDKLTKERRT